MKSIFLIAAVSLLGCGDASGPVGTIIGTWDLRSIARQPLPGKIGCCTDIIADQLIVRDNGSFTDYATLQGPNDQAPTQYADNGHWSVSGKNIVIVYSADGSSATGTWSDKHMTLQFDQSWEYTQQ